MNRNNSNRIYCDFNIHKNSVWKHNKSDKRIKNFRYENLINTMILLKLRNGYLEKKQVEKIGNPYRLQLPSS